MIDTVEKKRGTKRNHQKAREPKPTGEAEVRNSTPIPEVQPERIKPGAKASLVLQLLQRPEGATIVQIVAATDWLPHTTRSALTGLKKKGYEITSEKAEGQERVYRVAVG